MNSTKLTKSGSPAVWAIAPVVIAHPQEPWLAPKRLTTSSEAVRKVRISLLLLLLIALVSVVAGPVAGQVLEPVGAGKEQAEKDRTHSVYELTKTAKTFTDYENIERRCREGLNSDINAKEEKYLNSLLAWAENRMAETHRKNAIGLRKTGLEAQADEQILLAIKKYDQLIKTHPLTWRAWMGRAVIHAERDEYDAALKKFRQVLKLDSKNSKARFNCAELAFELKQYDEAIKEYSRLIADDPHGCSSTNRPRALPECTKESWRGNRRLSDGRDVAAGKQQRTFQPE